MSSSLGRDGILIFYGWWQLTVCFFAFLGLMAIWWHLGRKQGDKGQVWLALSILCWSLSGAVEIIFAYTDMTSSNPAYLEGLRSIFSLFNSLFILMGLPWFRYLPSTLKPLIQSNYWLIIISLPFLFSFLSTLNRMVVGSNYALISELDVYYALLTLVFLGYVLWSSFYHRRLQLLAWLSVIGTGATVIAQLYKFAASDIYQTLFSAIFKTTLIMIFFALALSWVKEMAEKAVLRPSDLVLSLFRRRTANNKREQGAKIGIGLKVTEVLLSPANFELLQRFVSARMSGEGWLEIKPKNDERKHLTYDINDHNELKRVMTALLDGLYGRSRWSKTQHEQPLKEALLEMSPKRERKVRLALPPQNLSMDL